jgi:predicted DCC family thiol-disulfide oxidoreductase YuxK
MDTSRVLLYDDYCPLCSWYSGLFVKFGLLNAENRIPFSKADIEILTSIDIERGRDEIPFFDRDTGATLYGIDTLLEIIGQKAPFVKSMGNFRPVKWFLQRLYKLISYNRKVIVARKCGAGRFDCSPAFSFFYRLVFMMISLLFNSIMLWPLHISLLSHLSIYHLTFIQLQFAHLSFVVINCIIASFFRNRQSIEYLGQVNVLALIAILSLIPVMILNNLIDINQFIVVACLFFLTVFIIKEYFRRMKYANIFLRSVITANLICLAAFLVYVFH